MQIDPMTFAEFLLANGDENLAQYLEQVDTLEPIPDAFFNPLYEKLKMYYVTGGMPESVLMWTETGMFLPCRKHCPESLEPMSVILPSILISASSRKSQ